MVASIIEYEHATGGLLAALDPANHRLAVELALINAEPSSGACQQAFVGNAQAVVQTLDHAQTQGALAVQHL